MQDTTLESRKILLSLRELSVSLQRLNDSIPHLTYLESSTTSLLGRVEDLLAKTPLSNPDGKGISRSNLQTTAVDLLLFEWEIQSVRSFITNLTSRYEDIQANIKASLLNQPLRDTNRDDWFKEHPLDGVLGF